MLKNRRIFGGKIGFVLGVLMLLAVIYIYIWS